MGKIRWTWILGGSAFAIALYTIIYFFIQTKDIQLSFNWKPMLIVLGVAIAAVFIIIGLVPWIKDLLRRKKETDKISDRPKDPVGTDEAMKIFFNQFIAYNNIPCEVSNEKIYDEYMLKPLNKNAIKWRTTRKFVNQARDFFKFDIIVREGDFTGTAVVIIPIDEGKKKIKENWNSFIEHDSISSTFNLKSGTFPLTSAKSYAADLLSKKAEWIEAGYSPSEADSVLGIDAISNGYGEPNQRKNPRIRNTAESMFNDYDEIEDVDDSISTDEIINQIDAARERNKG